MVLLCLEATQTQSGTSGSQFLEAPLQLQTESYEAFAANLHIGQENADRPTVEEELRKLQIDPEVFYRDARRLGVQRFSTDDLDPACEQCSAQPTGAAAVSSTAVPSGTAPLSAAPGGLEDGEGPMAGSWAFRPPARDMPAAADEDSGDEQPEAVPVAAVLRPGLNVPDHDDIEDIPFEEITLSGETKGGRMACETPRGLSAKLQIDSLTDEDDDEDFRGPVLAKADDGDEEDEVEAFSLDPEFDYDKVDNLSRRD
uniref:Uncharacterized protein n=1 Tax=Alexandrium andersonii TaxID=327968 RepID=A0A7S2FI17_9DINO|mmetsp:Transcript_25019/g.56770  ORF Transcript_25019/g.56770 Transcript_25019/m.56770 type:complete len:256 (+) Transcript_25019:55-822(+)